MAQVVQVAQVHPAAPLTTRLHVAPMAPVGPAAQGAPTDPWGTVDARGGSGVHNPYKSIKRIRSQVGSKSATWAFYTGVSQEDFSVHTSAVFLQ